MKLKIGDVLYSEKLNALATVERMVNNCYTLQWSEIYGYECFSSFVNELFVKIGEL